MRKILDVMLTRKDSSALTLDTAGYPIYVLYRRYFNGTVGSRCRQSSDGESLLKQYRDLQKQTASARPLKTAKEIGVLDLQLS